MQLSHLLLVLTLVALFREGTIGQLQKLQIPQNLKQELGSPQPSTSTKYRPVVIWHGLGDQYNSSGYHHTRKIFDELYPGIFVYPIYLDKDISKDEELSMFGDANEEVEVVCEQLSQVPELSNGFDAIGFSQGGLFVRALVERCPSVDVKSIISFGSPHMGVLELPLCKPDDWVCRRRNKLLKSQVWLDKVQKKVIPAQYFRDPADYANYVLHSNFLVSINNEKPFAYNKGYKDRFKKLEKLVLVTFTEDTVLVPKESSHFFDYDSAGNLLPFETSPFYLRNYIGLKDLHEEKKIDFLSIEADHMRIPEEFLKSVGISYIGTRV